MWPLCLVVLACLQAPLAPTHVRVRADMATTTSLSGTHRGGQTFVTFTKNSGSSAGTTYKVWRKATQITSLAGLTEIATLDADSWHLLYDDASVPAPQLSSGFIISDLGTLLASTQGLLVWTTAVSQGLA